MPSGSKSYGWSIRFRPNARVVVLHPDYLALCDGDHCAAMVLRQHQYWFERKKWLVEVRGLPEERLWVRKPVQETAEELFGLFGKNKITAAYALLVEREYLFMATITNSHDKARFYLFNQAKVQAAVDALLQDGQHPAVPGVGGEGDLIQGDSGVGHAPQEPDGTTEQDEGYSWDDELKPWENEVPADPFGE